MPDDRVKLANETSVARDKYTDIPALAAIVVVPDTYETVRRTMSHLQAQTVAKQIEVIIVTRSREQLKLDEADFQCFHSWHIVEVGTITSIAHAFTAGIRYAHAPVIALTEDHSFPDANWAEAFIDAHRKPWAAVGPSMCNSNPDTILSWTDFYQAYGNWSRPILSGPVRHLPGHNSSYKRDILLEFGNQLEELMQAESVLHRRLKAKGYDLFLESRTCTAHVNFSMWAPWIPLKYYTGRQFAATWSQSWSWPRRLAFILASPLILLLRLWNIQKAVRRSQGIIFFIRLLPAAFLGLLVESIGHSAGFAAGMGNSISKVAQYEFDRDRYI